MSLPDRRGGASGRSLRQARPAAQGVTDRGRPQALQRVGGPAAAGRLWRELPPAERNELAGLIREAVEGLPGQQRRVLRVFLAYYPETSDLAVLRREVSRAAGAEQTLASVKRALQEGRAKVRVFLK